MSLAVERIQALLFDIDGTLSNTDDHMVKRMENWLKPLGWLFRQNNPAPFARRLIMAAETPANFFYSALDRMGVDTILARWFNHSAQKRHAKLNPNNLFLLLPGIQEMLQTLSLHYPMAIVSARDRISSQLFLNHFNLAPYFRVVVTSQTCLHTKPYPDPLLYAASQMAIPIENCLMIGDTVVDVDAALAAGCQSLSVLCGFGKEKELYKAGTQHILEDTSQLKDFLLNTL